MKKTYFQRPTVAQVRKRDIIASDGPLEQIAATIATLTPDQSLCMKKVLLHQEPSYRFLKRGPIVPLVAPRSRNFRYTPPKKEPLLVLEAHSSQTPLHTLELQIRNLDRFDISGYGWIGEGRDQRYRHVSLGKILSGARLFAYESHLPSSEEDIKLYQGTGHASEQGLLAYTTISSECKSKPRHMVEIRGIPIHAHAHWKRLSTGHACPAKLWSEARYDHVLDPERIIYCKHEVAAYFKVAAHCAENLSNKHPAVLSPFVPPSQALVDFYKKLERNVFVEGKTKEEDRLLNAGESEQLLFAYVSNVGVRKAFHSDPSESNYKLKDRDWS